MRAGLSPAAPKVEPLARKNPRRRGGRIAGIGRDRVFAEETEPASTFMKFRGGGLSCATRFRFCPTHSLWWPRLLGRNLITVFSRVNTLQPFFSSEVNGGGSGAGHRSRARRAPRASVRARRCRDATRKALVLCTLRTTREANAGKPARRGGAADFASACRARPCAALKKNSRGRPFPATHNVICADLRGPADDDAGCESGRTTPRDRQSRASRRSDRCTSVRGELHGPRAHAPAETTLGPARSADRTGRPDPAPRKTAARGGRRNAVVEPAQSSSSSSSA